MNMKKDKMKRFQSETRRFSNEYQEILNKFQSILLKDFVIYQKVISKELKLHF
uniref:Uncharacterized protein n=1 Tax=Rhizophagus irregularis (strain DAOM 181602 / DAOM 197198 / MUCL 43194) TaxID=747089 RepID=U9UTR8_RHIID